MFAPFLAVLVTVLVLVGMQIGEHSGAGLSRRYGFAAVAAIVSWLILVAVAANLPADALKYSLWKFYLIQVGILILLLGSARGWQILDMMRPSGLAVLYSGLSVGIGAIFFDIGAVVPHSNYTDYLQWQDVFRTFTAISGAFLVLFLVAISGRALVLPRGKTARSPRDLLVGRILFVVFVAAMAWRSPYATMIWTPVACGIMLLTFRNRLARRWLIVFVIVGIAAAVSFESKRNAIFLLLPALLLEARYGNRKFNLKWIAIGIPMIFVAAVLILAMSQLRGRSDISPFEALANVPTYAFTLNNLALVSNNFELGYTFFHMHNATDAAMAMPHLQTHGETYLKALFVGVPNIIGWKPASFVDSYTTWWDPLFRARGGSWAATAIGEGYWNFGALGVTAIGVIFWSLDSLYAFLMRAMSGRGLIVGTICLVGCENFLNYIRGSGLDFYLAYCYASWVIVLVLLMPLAAMAGLKEGRSRHTRSMRQKPYYPSHHIS